MLLIKGKKVRSAGTQWIGLEKSAACRVVLRGGIKRERMGRCKYNIAGR